MVIGTKPKCFPSCAIDNKGLSPDDLNGETTDGGEETPSLPGEGVITYIDDMGVEEMSQYLRGKVFQAGSYHAAASIGEAVYFNAEGDGYYWFCNSMDQQSRIRAEYGIWGLEDGMMATTTQKMVEWVDGHFTRAYASTSSRYELHDYNEILTEVDIEDSNNFRMFKFTHEGYGEEMGFRWIGRDFYYCPAVAVIDDLEQYYAGYFSLMAADPHSK